MIGYLVNPGFTLAKAQQRTVEEAAHALKPDEAASVSPRDPAETVSPLEESGFEPSVPRDSERRVWWRLT